MLAMARGALFNRVQNQCRGRGVIDLYAGCGALGIEALSRGAAQAVFVERDPGCAAALRANLMHCGLADRAALHQGSVEEQITHLRESAGLILLDPPYPLGAVWGANAESRAVTAATAALLEPNGLLVFRQEVKAPPPDGWGDLEPAGERSYGRSRLCFFRRPGGEP